MGKNVLPAQCFDAQIVLHGGETIPKILSCVERSDFNMVTVNVIVINAFEGEDSISRIDSNVGECA